MAEIISNLSDQTSLDVTDKPISDGTSGFKASAEFTIQNGIGQYFLGSGSTGYTCNGSFGAPGYPDGKFTFSEDEGLLRIESSTSLDGTFGLLAFNMDSILSQKGSFFLYFLKQDGDKQNIVAIFNVPQTPDEKLKDLPDLQSVGYGGWKGPA